MMFKPRVKGMGKDFLKMKDGESVIGVFRGEPETFYQHWVAGRGQICTRAKGTCEECNKGEKGGFRFRVNIVIHENGALVAKVFEGGGKVYDQLASLGGEIDFSTHKVKITRTGSEQNTTYAILPVMKDGALKPDEIKRISEVKLVDLGLNEHDEDEAA